MGRLPPKNLTPDAAGRPAGLTYEQFSKVLRTGQDPDELGPNGLPRIRQVMPWPVIGKMTDLDLRAIYEYLRAIPNLPDNPTPSPEWIVVDDRGARQRQRPVFPPALSRRRRIDHQLLNINLRQ